jgi:hypothetical protein
MGHSSELIAIGVIAPGRTFQHAAELGFRLADAVLAALEQIETRESVTLGALTLAVELPLKRYPSREETGNALAEAEARVSSLADKGDSPAYRQALSEQLYRSITHYYAGETARFRSGFLPIALQGIRIQDSVFVAVPGELFVEVALRAKGSASCPVFVVGLANGYIGYLPSPDAYADGGYEVVSSRCEAAFADRLLQAIAQLEQRLIP